MRTTPRTHSSLHIEIPFHPWAYLGIFLISNTLLSYFSLPLSVKLSVGLLGLALPLGLAIWSILKEHPESKKESFLPPIHREDPPKWLWVLFFLALFFSRFYQLTAYPSWLTGDEGILSFLALSQKAHWQWRLLWGELQMEPLFIWLLGGFFKLFLPSLLSVRFFCAFLSILTTGLAYWSCRQFFPKSFSFIFCWLYSFSMMSLIFSRMCVPNVLPPLFEFLVLGWLGKFLKSQERFQRWRATAILGLVTGLGFYTYANWIAVAAVAGWWLAWQSLKNSKCLPYLFFFLFLTSLTAWPLFLTRLSPGGADHIRACFDPQSLSRPDYFIALFWNGMNSVPAGPAWGGLLNSLVGSLVLTGILIFIQTAGFRSGLQALWIALLCLLPGLLTNLAVNMFRISQIIPFLLVFATLAVTNLSFRKTQAQSWRLVAIVLFISSLMDAFHFAGPYTDSRFIPSFRQWRSVQYHDAYQILRNISQKEGPCYLFSEFNTDYDNKTLDVTCYPFDVLQNPSLSKDTPTWAAIIINAQYAPFLIRDFPGLRFKVLKTDKYGPNDPPPFGIFLIPVNQIPKEALTHWVQADRVYRETDLDIRNMSSALSWGDFSERLSPLKDINKDDRFLTTIYWEKCGFYNFLGKNFTAAAEDYQNAIRLGYPAAHLYYSLGVSLKTSGKVTDGQKALNKVQELSIHPFID